MTNSKRPWFDSKTFADRFHTDDALGAFGSEESTTFRLWAPTADAARLHLYRSGYRKQKPVTLDMRKGSRGTWEAFVEENLLGRYYTFRTKTGGRWNEEAVDPYARATGANGLRGMVLDLMATDPKGWDRDERPAFGNPTDAVIYEIHVRDATIHPRSGAKHKGLFLGLAERGTRGPGGVKTGLDHLRELGVTHVHLLPIADFQTVDELERPQTRYNWGYDPQNYNVPEGSYATDAEDGAVRIREFKTLVQALHKAGLRVVMDVVYNHTFLGGESCFHRLVPGYYHRQDAKGNFSNGSGCGNETASDRSMMRRYIIDSLTYWATEYHIDGFRFDLMGLHDIETMNQVRDAMDRIDPSILLYGEGWTGGDSPLSHEQRAVKDNTCKLNRIAAFSDTIRDAVKGSVNEEKNGGFVQGDPGRESTLKAAIVASVKHPQVTYPRGNTWHGPWAGEPYRCVSYCSCHDNHTLWDKLKISTKKGMPEAERIRMNKLAAAIVLTSQGIAFIHAGEDMLRTKNGVENSYNKPDRVNRIDWSRKKTYRSVFRYYRGLIELRRSVDAFRLTSAAQIRKRLRFLDMPSDGMVGYVLRDGRGRDEVVVLLNGTSAEKRVPLPSSSWHVVVDDRRAGTRSLRRARGATVVVPRRSALVLVKQVPAS